MNHIPPPHPPFPAQPPRDSRTFSCQDLLLRQGPSETVRGKDRQCWREEETQEFNSRILVFVLCPPKLPWLCSHLFSELLKGTCPGSVPSQARREGSCVGDKVSIEKITIYSLTIIIYSMIPMINIFFTGFYINIPYLKLFPPSSSCLLTQGWRLCAIIPRVLFYMLEKLCCSSLQKYLSTKIQG